MERFLFIGNVDGHSLTIRFKRPSDEKETCSPKKQNYDPIENHSSGERTATFVIMK